MAYVYLNDNDRKVLAEIKDKSCLQKEIDVLNKILFKNETKRQRSNRVASVYKKNKRQFNKQFARSKKEIAKMKNS